jgi:GNAT superfamily N-acetyltransferase
MEWRDPLTIRDARDGEDGVVRDVTLAAYEEYGATMPEPFWARYRRHLLATLAAEGPAERIVAERGGTIVGSVLLFPAAANAYAGSAACADYPEVRLLAVVPAARGEGVGAALMRECEKRARRGGATTLGLHTMDMMRTAVRLYERMGFVRAPDLDFTPAEGWLVKGYRLDLLPRSGR